MLRNKNVFITGCNRGIGKTMLKVFAENGVDTIIAHSRKPYEDYNEYLEELRVKYKVKIIPVYFDVTDYDEMKLAIKQIHKLKINVDILVNNAGIAHGGLFQMTQIEKIKEVFDINFFAMLELTQMIIKFMKRQKNGVIINISSVSGIDLKVGNCAYGTSKAAVIAFTKTLAAELAPLGIRVNAIAPGLTDTDMAKLMEENAGIDMIRNTSMNRLGSPDEIANTAVFLSSDSASFITGQAIRVDGGMI